MMQRNLRCHAHAGLISGPSLGWTLKILPDWVGGLVMTHLTSLTISLSFAQAGKI